MNYDPRLYVEIHPFDGPHPPHPHPIDEGHFDPNCVYKVLGVYNPSETSECYFMLANPEREIWFIPQRHVRAYRLIQSDEFWLPVSATPASPPAPEDGDAGVAATNYSAAGRSSIAGPISTLPVGSNRLP